MVRIPPYVASTAAAYHFIEYKSWSEENEEERCSKGGYQWRWTNLSIWAYNRFFSSKSNHVRFGIPNWSTSRKSL